MKCIDDSEKTHLKYETDAFFTKAFFERSNLGTNKTFFFFTVQSAWQGWSVWRGGKVSVGQGMLKTTCAILMKPFASEQRLLTNIYVRTLL